MKLTKRLGRKKSTTASRYEELEEKYGSTASESKFDEDSAVVPGLMIFLDYAEDLPSGDSNGLSDPYVVFQSAADKHKSSVVKKTLNPSWQESFFLEVPESEKEISIEVRDKDTLGSESLCTATVNVTGISVGEKPKSFSVRLTHSKKRRAEASAGTLHFTLQRVLTTPGQAVQSSKTWNTTKFSKRQVVVELIQGLDLLPMDMNGKSDPYVTLRIGKIKHKSKVISATLDPKWRQRFEFLLDDEGELPSLKAKVWDRDFLTKNDPMGQFEVDLAKLKPHVVTDSWYDVSKNGKPAGHVQLQITVFDQTASASLAKEDRSLRSGTLKAHIVRAKNLRARDKMTGQSDPYVEIQVGKARVRSPVIPRTLNPEFDCVLEVPVTDIYSVAKVTLWDYDSRSKPDFLGCFAIPLLEIRNGNIANYALKNKDLSKRGKGEVRIAFNFTFSKPMGYLDFKKPAEPNFMAAQKPFSMRRLRNATDRLNSLALPFLNAATGAVDLVLWKKGIVKSVAAMVLWSLFWLFFSLWHTPLVVIGVMFFNRFFRKRKMPVVDRHGLLVTKMANPKNKKRLIKGLSFEDDDADPDLDDIEEPDVEPEDLDEKEKTKESKAGLMKQVSALRQLGGEVQNQLEKVADSGERVKNLLNWTVPFLTEFSIVPLLLVSVTLYFIHWNVLIMLGGNGAFVATFAKKYVVKKTKWDEEHLAPREIVSRIPSDPERVFRSPIILDSSPSTKRSSKNR